MTEALSKEAAVEYLQEGGFRLHDDDFIRAFVAQRNPPGWHSAEIGDGFHELITDDWHISGPACRIGPEDLKPYEV